MRKIKDCVFDKGIHYDKYSFFISSEIATISCGKNEVYYYRCDENIIIQSSRNQNYKRVKNEKNI